MKVQLPIFFNWIYLILAGLCEVLWAVNMKNSQGFTKLIPTLVTFFGICVSIWLMTLALRQLPVGICYIVLTSIGTIGTTIYGILFMQESTDYIKLCCIAAMILSMIILSTRA